MEQNVTAETNRIPISDIKQKMKFTGKVIKTTLAGAAIDIGAEKPAMLHVSQLVSDSNEPILSVTDVMKVGEEIEVWVKRIRDQRIELTMIKPLDLEWREIKTGLAVKGKVVRLETFGAFVEIGAERPGLIHISEMAHGYVKTPSDVMNEGDEIDAEIIDFNRKKKQIKLSIKALTPEPEKEEKFDQSASSPVFLGDDQPKREKIVRKKREKKNKKKDSSEYSTLEFDLASGEAEEEPTAMELAIRSAMDKANAKKQESKKKLAKSSAIQDDLLARTLDQKSG
ncbi:MAG TPA: S1 RNA-binding domain-containing protein [Anaerolineaceae bacterium]|nr:S1 RNA-binding domain-containing protein [Anaerolineaceae bacterium]